MAGLGLDGLAADEEGGAELCSLAPPDVSMLPDEGFMAFIGFVSVSAAEDGGAELCSLAPVDVSGEPALLESSAARAGVRAINATTAVQLSRRYILLSLDIFVGIEVEIST
jgi:CRP-like cAMP-binding protein